MNKTYMVRLRWHDRPFGELVLHPTAPTEALEEVRTRFPAEAGFHCEVLVRRERRRLLEADAQGIRVVALDWEEIPLKNS